MAKSSDLLEIRYIYTVVILEAFLNVYLEMRYACVDIYLFEKFSPFLFLVF